MTSAETLTQRYTKIPRIEETGPQKGNNGARMAKRGGRTRMIHLVLCIIGLVPFALKLCRISISPILVAVGFGLVGPGGGFVACAGPATVIIGLYVCFYLWKRKGMRIQERMGSWFGIVGF